MYVCMYVCLHKCEFRGPKYHIIYDDVSQYETAPKHHFSMSISIHFSSTSRTSSTSMWIFRALKLNSVNDNVPQNIVCLFCWHECEYVTPWNTILSENVSQYDLAPKQCFVSKVVLLWNPDAHRQTCLYVSWNISRLLKIIGLFCKRAL